ncbi:response regulator [Pseudohongiella spirulinae]|uniref:Chemotaxis protein CheY n=1 Tax=Pseudohongiella spirulinae TaxID=1249552 RepID=A0A0S2KH47_9GAMM|nr:response regulator [Pseudohongiella spirulinae]ALO47664.1 chemotaxis protein CheY [Pseudohongiella spirulinae]
MKIRILLCDDATFIRDLIKRTVRRFLPQCEVFEASDGRKAQSILNRQPIDLILSDWEMPGMSGEELLQWVRGEEKFAKVPFIMITSLGGKEHIMRAVQAGVSDYLGKPFTPEELMHKVRKALVKSGKLEKISAGSTSAKGGPFSSLEVFSGKADPVVGGSAAALTGSGKTDDKPKLKGTGLIRWGDVELRCMIKSISIDEVLMVSKRAPRHPGVFEQVELTLSSGNSATKTINGLQAYVHSTSAVEKRPDSDFVNVLVRFSGPDEEQRKLLSEFIVDMP